MPDITEKRPCINIFKLTPTNLQGFAEIQAPAVMQKVEYIQDYPFVRQQVVEEGSMINMSVEIRPGEGRVLVQTKPLMGHRFPGCC
jgi:hypothetical protein